MNKLLLMSLPVMALWFVVLLLPSEAGASPTVPRPPVNVSGVSGDGLVTVSWDIPPDAGSTLPGNGGSQITGYKIIALPGEIEASSSTNNVAFSGLTNGVAYKFKVIATNSVGDSDPSEESSSVTPATVPAAPSSVNVQSRNASVLVEWMEPVSNGGSPITGYIVYVGLVAESGIESVRWQSSLNHEVGVVTSATVPGLTNDVPYVFTVKALNIKGSSENSSKSNVVKPYTNYSANPSPDVTWELSDPQSTNKENITLSVVVKDDDLRKFKIINAKEGISTPATLKTVYLEDKYVNHEDQEISFIEGSGCGWGLKCIDLDIAVALIEGSNTLTVSAIDYAGSSSVETFEIIGDFTAPSGSINMTTVLSSGEGMIGDSYFLTAALVDTNSNSTKSSGLSSVKEVATNSQMNDVSAFSDLVIKTFSLSKTGDKNTTHMNYSQLQSGLPVGTNTFQVVVTDNAGNSSTLETTLPIRSTRTNRNYFLFPGNNYVGLGIIPHDGNFWTNDDASIDRLMRYDVTDSVADAFKNHVLASGQSTVKLSDIVESTWAYSVGGAFLLHSPNGSSKDTLENLQPHQGMIMVVKSSFQNGTEDGAVFRTGIYPGSSTAIEVPIVFNIKGVFVQAGEIPPGRTMRVGYNLLAPHALGDTLFDTVLRGALIPTPLVTHASTISNDLHFLGTENKTVTTTVRRNESNSIFNGGTLKLVESYWVYIHDDPNNNAENAFGDQLGPTITP